MCTVYLVISFQESQCHEPERERGREKEKLGERRKERITFLQKTW